MFIAEPNTAAGGGPLLVSLSISTRLSPVIALSLALELESGPPEMSDRGIDALVIIRVLLPRERELHTRQLLTTKSTIQRFISKIVYRLHITHKEFEISGEIIEHMALCYIQNVIELQTVFKTDVEQF